VGPALGEAGGGAPPGPEEPAAAGAWLVALVEELEVLDRDVVLLDFEVELDVDEELEVLVAEQSRPVRSVAQGVEELVEVDADCAVLLLLAVGRMSARAGRAISSGAARAARPRAVAVREARGKGRFNLRRKAVVSMRGAGGARVAGNRSAKNPTV